MATRITAPKRSRAHLDTAPEAEPARTPATRGEGGGSVKLHPAQPDGDEHNCFGSPGRV